MEDIVQMSTSMFERLAQYYDFHYTVDLSILVSAAQEKVVKWLLKWQPKKGRLFSWFSKCAKNAFRSELVKVNQYRKRFHVTSDNLEKFYGVEDHEIDKRSLAHEFKRSLQDLTCRWGDPQEIGAIRFLVECIVDDDSHDKRAAIRSASYAFCISPDLAKFFYDWSLTAMRHLFYDKVYVPLTWQDLVIAANTYTFLADLFDYMKQDAVRRFIVTHQGMRIKIPTLVQLSKVVENYNMQREVDRTDLDPDSVAEVARKYKKTARAAQEIFDELVEMQDPKRTGEFSVYGDDDTEV